MDYRTTSSYLTSSGSVDFTDITSVPSGIISGSSQITVIGFVSESGDSTPRNCKWFISINRPYDARYQLSGSSIPFDGNRIVSQEKLPTMFTSSFNQVRVVQL